MSDPAIHTAKKAVQREVHGAILENVRDFPAPPGTPYTPNDYARLAEGVEQALSEQFNNGNPKGMAELLDDSTDVYSTKANDNMTAYEIIESSKKEADDKKAAGDATAEPLVTSFSDASHLANIETAAFQAIIGAKLGGIQALKDLVGAAVTDAIVNNQLTGRPKPVDDVHLDVLLAAIKSGATRPAAQSLLDEIVAALTMAWDMTQKAVVNMNKWDLNAALLKAKGINLDHTQKFVNIMANAETAAAKPYGTELVVAVRNIRSKYPLNHEHDEASIKEVAAELAKADALRNLADAEDLAGHAKSVSDTLTQLTDLMHDDGLSVASEFSQGTAAAAGSDAESTSGRSRRSAKGKGGKGGRGRETTRRRSTSPSSRSQSNAPKDSWKKNPCKWCKKYKRRNQHPNYTEGQCFFNPKFDKWRPQWVCTEIEVPYVPRHKFDDEDDE